MGVMGKAAGDGAPLLVDLRTDEAAVVIRLTGQLDLSTARVVDSQIGRLDGLLSRPVVLDLQGLEFLDCSGARPLTRLSAELASHGGRLTVSGATRLVAYVLVAAGLGESFQR
jgi:anti-anti-sigma factor